MNKDKALKMAIEALDFFQTHSEFWKDTADEAIQACKEALAQPAQEPVALHTSSNPFNSERHGLEVLRNAHPAPEQNEFAKTTSWQGLSDDEIRILEDTHKVQGTVCSVGVKTFARAIEQALKEKNT